MNIDIKGLFNDEQMMLDWIVDAFGIPDDVFLKCGTSYWSIVAGGHIRLPKELVEKASADFEILCQSAPHIPREAMESLSLAYGTFAVITRNGTHICNEEDGDLQSHLQALFTVTMMRGMAMGKVGMAAGVMQSVNVNTLRKKALSESGAKGALVRLQPYANLKSWAIKEGQTLAASKNVARRLAAQLPAHLADISKDPGRLIYETLLNRNKPS